MRKRLTEYIAYLETLLKENKEDTNWKKVYEDLLIQIKFYQHERLIHLIVTALFGLMEILCVCFVVYSFSPLIYLAGALLVLLIPYIRHYYFLENKTQYLYKLYDEIEKKI